MLASICMVTVDPLTYEVVISSPISGQVMSKEFLGVVTGMEKKSAQLFASILMLNSSGNVVAHVVRTLVMLAAAV